MTIFDTVKGTVTTAVDTISSVAQTIVDKNRTNAKLNRLRLVMKNESELMNRAYIALGKQYYEMQKKGDLEVTENQQKLFEVIEKSKAKIAKARECYRDIVDSQNDIFYGTPETVDYKSADVVDITVACSNENEYETSPFEAVKDAVEETAEEVKEEIEEKIEPVAEKLKKRRKKTEKVAEELVKADEEPDDSEAVETELF